MKKMMNKWMVACCLLALSGQALTAQTDRLPDEAAYMIPTQVQGVKNPTLSLNGTWDFKFSPESRWTDIQVPGEAVMQGYGIEHDKPFEYRKTFVVPKDFKGQRIVLRFDGVYCQAVLYVNGKRVREHFGGFTHWETDVTPYVHPGRKNELRLTVTDRLDDISYAAGYAHHPVGGILRGVTLFALPKQSVSDFYAETELDSLYRDALLKIGCRLDGQGDVEALCTLIAPDGAPCTQTTFKLREGENTHSLSVKAPEKWDAEHPNLYTLNLTLREAGKELCSFSRRIGFREVKIVKERMLVNGMPVKLRGACRHDLHPTLGRSTTKALDSLDVILFKRANMNFVRTSHYPPSEDFLEFCDRYGVYVESETAVCFVDTHRQKNYAPANSQNDPTFTHRYLSQCREMVKAFRSHPAILFWSIGNESVYGSNFQQCWDWVKATDTTRPVIFSYPGTVGKRKPVYDILSMHYPGVDGNLGQMGFSVTGFQTPGMPAVFDEWAHPACYTYATLQTDPNIREFWGQSIDKMWANLFESSGGLGGAIWGYIDETFAVPALKAGTPFWKEFAHTAKPAGFQGNCVGYGDWGIVDVWRREKPEYWATKKAYSPVRLMTGKEISYIPEQPIALTVYNRFDHTDLNEVIASYTYRNNRKALRMPSVRPHQKGMILIPADEWREGEALVIEFRTATGELIDRDRVVLGKEQIQFPATLSGSSLKVSETNQTITVKGTGFEIPFDKASGMIVNATVDGKTVIARGPFLNLYINLNHLSGAEVRKIADHFTIDPSDWQKESISYRETNGNVLVTLVGTYKEVHVDLNIRITPAGTIAFAYQTVGVPNGFLRETGLSFELPDSYSQLNWKRNGHWNCYPEGAFAGNEGSASLSASQQSKYGERPAQAWQLDTHDYYYWADAGAPCDRPLSRMAKGMKENIYYYTLSAENGHGLSVVSREASMACRINKGTDARLMLYANTRWDYPEIAWGNYCKTLEAVPCFGQFEMQLK